MIEYDYRVNMWWAYYTDSFGRLRQRWFHTKAAAEKWLANRKQ